MLLRCRFLGHVFAATIDCPHSTNGEDEDGQERQIDRKRHLLGFIHDIRPALCSSHVLLRMAGQVRQRQQATGSCAGSINSAGVFFF